jgi:hypothetical protein
MRRSGAEPDTRLLRGFGGAGFGDSRARGVGFALRDYRQRRLKGRELRGSAARSQSVWSEFCWVGLRYACLVGDPVQRIALFIGALLFIVACEQAPSSPTSPPPNLQVRGEITVSASSNAGIGSIQAQVDGRNIGWRGGSDPYGSPKLTVQLSPDNVPEMVEAAKLQPGAHEIAVVLSTGLITPSGKPAFVTDPTSRIEIVDRDRGVVLGTAPLRSQEVSAGNGQVIRWTIDVDAGGRVRVQ